MVGLGISIKGYSMKTLIHVNQHIIKSNRKKTVRDPVFTVKQGRLNRYGQQVTVEGPCTVVYSPDKPLSCGATVWIETESNVTISGETTWKQLIGDDNAKEYNIL